MALPEMLEKLAKKRAEAAAAQAIAKKVIESSSISPAGKPESSSKPTQQPKGELRGNIGMRAEKTPAPKEAAAVKDLERVQSDLAKLSEAGKSVLNSQVPVENAVLTQRLAELQGVQWSDASRSQWENVGRILANMPKQEGLSEADRLVYQKMHQALLTHYYDHYYTFNKAGVAEHTVSTLLPEANKSEYLYEASGRPAMSDQPKNSRAWTEDIAEQMIAEGRRAPELHQEVSIETARLVVQEHAKDPSISWLTHGKVPEDQTVVRIVYDMIEAGDLAAAKEFLYIKAVQLKEAGIVGLSPDQLAERTAYHRQLIGKTMDEYKKDDLYAEFLQMVQSDMEPIGGVGGPRPRRRPPPGAGAGMPSYEFTNDMKDFGMGAEAYALEEKVDKFNKKMRFGREEDRGRVIYNFLEGERHDGIRFNELVLEAADRNPELYTHLENLRKEALNWLEEYNHERGIERGWSSLYLDLKYLRKAWISPDSLLRSLQDEANMYQMGMPIPNSPLNRYLRGTLYAGGVSKAAEHIRQQVEQYIQSEEYVDHRVRYLRKESNWRDISRLSGEVIDGTAGHTFEDHKWYKQVKDRNQYEYFKAELSKNVNMRESLSMLYTGWQSGTEPEKLKPSFSNFGEESIISTLKNRPINIPMWNMYQRIAREELKWKNGKMHAPNAHTHERIFTRLVGEAKMHQGRLDNIWNHWEGSGGVALSDSDIQNSAREVIMLATVTGRRATLVQMALTPREAGGQNGSGPDYIGESADSTLLATLGPLRYFLVRWGLEDPVIVDTLRQSAYIEAERYGLVEKWSKQLSGVAQGSEEFNKIAEWAFYIQEPNNADAVKKCLSWLKWNPDGSIRKNPPTTLAELTKKDLQDWIVVRQGIEMFDARSSGAYNFWEWGQNLGLVIPALQARFTGARSESIALLERTKMAVGDLLSSKDHKILHAKQHALINKDLHHGPEGDFVKVGRFDPLSTMEALYTKGHKGARDAFHKLLPDMNLVRDATGGTEAIIDERFDLLTKRVRLPMEYIDEKMANMRRGRVDYSNPSPEEVRVVREVCRGLRINPDKYLSLMGKLSKFALSSDTLKDVVHPAYVTHFGVVQYMDVRLAEIDNDWAPEQWSRQGSQDPDAGGSLLFRWAGDTSNSRRAVNEHLLTLLRTNNPEVALKELRAFFETAEMSGGYDTLLLGTQSLGGGILRSAIMDKLADFAGTDPESTMFLTSNRVRAGGQGQISLRRDKADHFMHEVEAIANTNYHQVTPGMAHALDKITGMGINIGPWRIPTIRLYNAAGFVSQAAAILVLASYENARKGFSEGSGGGSSGGGGDHH